MDPYSWVIKLVVQMELTACIYLLELKNNVPLCMHGNFITKTPFIKMLLIMIYNYSRSPNLGIRGLSPL